MYIERGIGTMTIKVYEIRFSGKLNEHSVLNSFKQFFATPIVQNSEFNLYMGEITFVTPSGISLLYNLVEWLKDYNNSVKLLVPFNDGKQVRTKVMSYLDDSLFFERVLGYKIFEGSSLRSTTIPLTNVSISSSTQWINTIFNPWLSRHTHYPSYRFANIEMMLQEILNNTRDHSTKDLCYLYAQYYPNKNKIEIAISDIGVGIPYNVRKVVKHDFDWQYIKESMNRGFTTETQPGNRGEGLYILKKYMIENRVGNISIISGSGYYKIFSNGSEYCSEIDYKYPGTYISLELKLDCLDYILTEEHIEGGVDLEW